MKSINIREAKTHLSRLVERVQAGGGLKAHAPVPDDFNTMFEKEIEALFAGASPAGTGRKRK